MKCNFIPFLLFLTTLGLAQGVWIETTQEDFADGTYERNLYASHYGCGAVEFTPRFDLNNDGYIDLFVSEAFGPNVRIYWGDSTGYNPVNVTLFPTSGGSNNDAADLNGDGYTDFIVSHQFNPRITIYWGTPSGPNPGFYFDLPALTNVRQAVFVADYDKNGYLDIATGQEYISGHGAVFWGDSNEYNINNRTDLPLIAACHNTESADLDWNGWLDLIFTNTQGSGVSYTYIYWGNSTGFSTSDTTILEGLCGNHGSSVADLNRDRYLDLIMQGAYDQRSYIYWGSTSGYSSSNRQTLNPAACNGGSSVAHMNSDGYLDIIYHHGGYGASPQRIYWGSDTGYSDSCVTTVGPSLETTGGLVADLNSDGEKDIYVNVHSPGDSSYILWGPGFNTFTRLPKEGQDNKAMFREIGNVYNRSYMEFYISSVFDVGEPAEWGTAIWDDSLPTGTSIRFQVRTGNTPTHDSTWSTWYVLYNGEDIPGYLDSRYIQYMANLYYTNPCYLPMLKEVQIEYYTFGVEETGVQNTTLVVSASPNPFSHKTIISYNVPTSNSIVCLNLYDASGRSVNTLFNGHQHKGTYTIPWYGDDDQGHNLPNGIYWLFTTIDGTLLERKIIYIQ